MENLVLPSICIVLIPFYCYILYQAFSLPYLYRKKKPVSFRNGLGLSFFLVMFPAFFYFLGMILYFGSDSPHYKSDFDFDWRRCIDNGVSGYALFPYYLLVFVFLQWSLPSKKDLLNSHFNFMGLLSFCLVIGSQASLSSWSDERAFGINFIDISASFFICLLLYLPYALLLFGIWRNRERNLFNWRSILFWASILYVSFKAKFYYAYEFYQSLETQRPPPIDPMNCFIVTAASQGHPVLVKSTYDSKKKKLVNQQLKRMWAFEDLLKERVPTFHKYLRLIYNRVGPIIARWIRHPLVADLVYLALKPLEWTAWAMTKIRK